MASSLKKVHVKIERTEKFTRNVLSVNFILPLDPSCASHNALLSGVMGLGCAKYESLDKISRFLEEQYGATFASSVQQIGGFQIIRFAVTFIRNAFVLNGENLAEKMFDFLYEILRRPLLENGIFKEDIFRTEKQNKINKIQSKINEKRRYALDRCLEETHKGEPFGVSPDGEIEILEKLTAADLTPTYEKLFSSAKVLIGGVGDFDETSLSSFAERLFGDTPDFDSDWHIPLGKAPALPKRVEEEFAVNQSVLALGFRKEISSASEDMLDFLVAVSVYGGSPVSKLFMNVREKLSLCYFCSAMDSQLSGSMFVLAGIAAENADKAYREIMLQLEDMRNGKISETEIDDAKKALINDYLRVSDELFLIERFSLRSFVSGMTLTIDEIIERISAVTKDGIVHAAKRISLDTEYFLKGTAEDPSEREDETE